MELDDLLGNVLNDHTGNTTSSGFLRPTRRLQAHAMTRASLIPIRGMLVLYTEYATSRLCL